MAEKNEDYPHDDQHCRMRLAAQADLSIRVKDGLIEESLN